MEAHLKTSIEVINNRVAKCLERCKNILKNYNVDDADARLEMNLLKTYNCRYTAELHLLMEKGNPSSEDVIRHTDIQLECEEVIVKMESKLNSQQKESILKGDKSPSNSRLPKLELSKFKGDILKWCEFWGRFSSSVDGKKISKVDKFSYLQACLEGEAREAIQGLETTELNYDIAITTLKEKFGKTNLVIDAHYKKLIDLQRKNNSSIEIRRLLSEIERNLRV